MNDKVRVGVIGSGFIGRIHMDMFSGLESSTVAGITDFVRPLAEQAAARYGIGKVFESAEALIESKDIDAVVIGVPNKFHAPLAVQALGHGKHVLLEKPMAINADGARRIVEAQRKSGRTLMIAHQMRWNALSLQTKRNVEGGELGEVYNAKAGMMRRKAIPGWGSWFTRMDESGGGPLIDIGVHMLDLAMWFLGNPKPVSVFGSTYAKFGPKKKGTGTWGTPQWDGYFDVEDLATAMIRLDNGATLTLDVSWAANTDSDSGHYIHLMGTDGGVSLYGNHLVLTGQKFDRSFDVRVDAPANEENPRLLLSRHFIECVRDGKQPVSDGMSGLVNSTILDAIYESAKSGELVSLDWGFLNAKEA